MIRRLCDGSECIGDGGGGVEGRKEGRKEGGRRKVGKARRWMGTLALYLSIYLSISNDMTKV